MNPAYLYALISLTPCKTKSLTIGLFLTPEEAINTLYDNSGFVVDPDTYKYVVIERLSFGLSKESKILFSYEISKSDSGVSVKQTSSLKGHWFWNISTSLSSLTGNPIAP